MRKKCSDELTDEKMQNCILLPNFYNCWESKRKAELDWQGDDCVSKAAPAKSKAFLTHEGSYPWGEKAAYFSSLQAEMLRPQNAWLPSAKSQPLHTRCWWKLIYQNTSKARKISKVQYIVMQWHLVPWKLHAAGVSVLWAGSLMPCLLPAFLSVRNSDRLTGWACGWRIS